MSSEYAEFVRPHYGLIRNTMARYAGMGLGFRPSPTAGSTYVACVIAAGCSNVPRYVVSPAQGQSDQQMNNDQFDCNLQAQKQTGYNPDKALTEGAIAGLLIGGAAGAGLGAAAGVAGGIVGTGASVGAGTSARRSISRS